MSDLPSTLTLGPIELLFDNGDLRYIRLAGREVLRRIYLAVRDCSWGTIPGQISDLHYDSSPDAFHIRYRCEHRAGDIHFAWTARIHGRSTVRHNHLDAQITFAMEGQALTPFQTNRTGFCVLHPIAECAGQPCTIKHPDGRIESATFPRLIAAHAPFTDIRAMSHQVSPGLHAELSFDGEAFETEDQRNWTDTSYKTYCRPLTLPFPYPLQQGQPLRQTVTLRLTGQLPATPSAGKTHRLTLGPPIACLPALGLRGADTPTLTPTQAHRLRALNLSHLRIDIKPGQASRLLPAIQNAQSLSLPLEIALHLAPVPESDLEQILTFIRQHRPEIARWLIYADRRPIISPDQAQQARRHLSAYDPSIPIGGGTIGNFAELNRNRPPAGLLDVLAYPATPQVHAIDDLSLFENLEAQAHTVATVRSFAPGLPVAVGPVMLHRRPDPFAAGKSGAEEPIKPDPRQTLPLAAAWTLGSIKYLAEAGADSITYYDLLGPFGVMQNDTPFPLYQVLSDIGQFAAAQVLAFPSSDPLSVLGLALRRPGRTCLLIAALRPDPITVTLQGIPASLPHTIDLAGHATARLDFDSPQENP